MKRLFYKYFSGDYFYALRLIAAHFREKRVRAGRCYAPGCQQDGMVWLDRAGIFCWDHYCAEMKARRGDAVSSPPGRGE